MKELAMSVLKLAIWPLAAALVIGLYFAGNIKGYYRFKKICGEQAGLKIYQPLKKNVGWITSEGHYSGPITLYYGAYSRFQKEKDGLLYDATLAPKKKISDLGVTFLIANTEINPKYELRVTRDVLPEELRLAKNTTQVIDLENGKIALTYIHFDFSTFEQAKTILAASSGETCPEYANFGPQDSNARTTLGERDLGIQSAFK